MKSQLSGFIQTVSTLGEPLPEQMGYFLEGLVGSLAPRLRQVPEEVSDWFADGFEKIGWDVVSNSALPGLKEAGEVMEWLDKAYTQASSSHLKLTVLPNGEHEWVCADSDDEDELEDKEKYVEELKEVQGAFNLEKSLQ